MGFYFDEKKTDSLMAKINLRDLSSRAKQWDHPVKGLLKYHASLKENGKDILKVPKKQRELYCTSLVALALKNDSQLDWWINMPHIDPPDGLVITFKEEKGGALKGLMREVEVVEHRSQPHQLFDVIHNKVAEKSYNPDTILVCLSLTPAIYDFKSLSERLIGQKSSTGHIFVVFAGVAISEVKIKSEEIRSSYSMVQLFPTFEQTTFNLQPHLKDFEERYYLGRESRLIEGSGIYYGTANPKFGH